MDDGWLEHRDMVEVVMEVPGLFGGRVRARVAVQWLPFMPCSTCGLEFPQARPQQRRCEPCAERANRRRLHEHRE